MKSRLYIFYILLNLYLLKPLYDWFENILHFSITPYYNILILLFVFVAVIFNNFYISFKIINFAFIFSFILGLFVGFLKFNLNLQFLSHLYFYMMPIFMVSYGYKIGMKYYLDVVVIIQNIAANIFYFLLFLAICYPFIHSAGYWDYFGYSTGLLVCYSLMKNKSTSLKVASIISDLFSGKRSPLVVWLFVIILENRILFLILILFLSIFGTHLFDFLPSRYISVFDLDFHDSKSLYLATGGRSAEWSSIGELNDGNYFQWVFGNGFGVTYESFDDFFDGGTEIRHYSHLTPLSYILISGLLSFIIIYIPLFVIVLRAFILKDKFYLFLVIIFLYSFAGASLHVEPIPWIFIGLSIAQISKSKRMKNYV